MLIKDWMSKTVITVKHDDSLSDTIHLFEKKIISMVPVLKDGKFVGIVTDGDVKKGAIKNLTDMIRAEGGRLCSILASYDNIEEGFRKVFIHAFGIGSGNFDSLIEKFQKSNELLYAADLSRNIRTIY